MTTTTKATGAASRTLNGADTITTARVNSARKATPSKAAPSTTAADRLTAAAPAFVPPSTEPAAPASTRVTRTDQLAEALRSPDGASIEDLCERFGWLPHSARAALTALRKRGLDVQRSKAGTVTIYRIAAA